MTYFIPSLCIFFKCVCVWGGGGKTVSNKDGPFYYHYEHMTLKITLKTSVKTLKFERTKDMSNVENFQWDYKGLSFLNNNNR